MSKSNELTNEIIKFIYEQGGFSWRASSVGVYDTKKQTFRTAAKKGVADVLACYKGTLFAVEIKIGSDRLSDEQEGFMRNVNHVGGVAFVATDFEQFKKEWYRRTSSIYDCMTCHKRMQPVVDSVAKKITGHLWRCDKCMPEGVSVSIG